MAGTSSLEAWNEMSSLCIRWTNEVGLSSLR
jgi:hypothetical protein